jgi:hypothetical protein
MKRSLDECVAKPDCKARVACMGSIIRPGQGKSVK